MGTKQSMKNVRNDCQENLSVPPGFVSLTSLTLKRTVTGGEVSDPVAVAGKFKQGPIDRPLSNSDIEKFKSSFRQRPWILHDQSDRVTQKCGSEQIELDMKCPVNARLPEGVIRGCANCSNCVKVTARWHPEESCLPVLDDAPVFRPAEEVDDSERAESFPEEDERGADKRVEAEIRRGVTSMRKIINARSKGIKLPIGWNEKGQAVDPNKATLVGYIGVLARQKVPITSSDWRQVSEPTKNAIWDEVALSFDIEEMRKKYVLAEVGKLARNFRSYLSRVWVRDDGGNINYNPPSQYKIPQADWTKFLEVRLSEDFQQLSKENQERAKDPEYPYRKSSLGYALVEQIEMKKRKETGSDCTEVTRALVWKISHSDKKNEIDNVNVRRVVNEMKCISQESTSHSRNDRSRDDLLAKVLKKKEHPGRVRGVGFGVSQREYFMDPKLSKQMEMENLRSMVKGLTESLSSLQRKVAELRASGSRQPHED